MRWKERVAARRAARHAAEEYLLENPSATKEECCGAVKEELEASGIDLDPSTLMKWVEFFMMILKMFRKD